MCDRLSQREGYEFLAPPGESWQPAVRPGPVHNGQPEAGGGDGGGDWGAQSSPAWFQLWTLQSQLRFSYLLYINKRTDSDYFMQVVTRLLQNFNTHEASTRELTVCLLLIYFKCNHRSRMKIQELPNQFDLTAVQSFLAAKLSSGEMTDEELCVVCLGMKRISNLHIFCQQFRKSIYLRISSMELEEDSVDGFILETLMSTLMMGNSVYQDDKDCLKSMISSLQQKFSKLNLKSRLLVLSFTKFSSRNEVLESWVFYDLKTSLQLLTTRSLVSLCEYISTCAPAAAVAEDISLELGRRLCQVRTLENLTDILHCAQYLANVGIYSEKVNSVVFSAINAISSDQYQHGVNMTLLVYNIVIEVLKRCQVESQIVENVKLQVKDELDIKNVQNKTTFVTVASKIPKLPFSNRVISSFTSLPVFISTSYMIDKKDTENIIDPDISDFLLRSQQREFDRQQSEVWRKKLQLAREAVVGVTGCDCAVTRLLPHITSPDLVWSPDPDRGLPPALTQPGCRPRRAPPGEWWVAVLAPRASTGLVSARARLLVNLGYHPIVIPYQHLLNSDHIHTNIARHIAAQRRRPT